MPRAATSQSTRSSQGLRQAHVSFGGINESAGGNGNDIPFVPQSPYVPTNRAQTAQRIVDKSSIIWRDFLAGVKRRKRLLNKLRELALTETSTSGMLKRMLLELRQMTLRIIEDALEIEYRSNFGGRGGIVGAGNKGVVASSSSGRPAGAAMQLPPLSTFRGMEEKEDVFALADMITDLDDLSRLPVIAVFLPRDFPTTRNPFLLGKDVDDLSTLTTPQPTPGNLEEELKVLELLRYKRAAKALLRAEAQVMNNMPMTLQDIERIWVKMDDDSNLEKLIRAVATFLANEKNVSPEPDFSFITGVIQIEPHEFLVRLNLFRGETPPRVDVQASVRLLLRNCRFEYLDDVASVFLIEWINSVLSGNVASSSSSSSSASYDETSSLGSKNKYNHPSKGGGGGGGVFSIQGKSNHPTASNVYNDSHIYDNNPGNAMAMSRHKLKQQQQQQQQQVGDLVSIVSSSSPDKDYRNLTELKPPINKAFPPSRVPHLGGQSNNNNYNNADGADGGNKAMLGTGTGANNNRHVHMNEGDEISSTVDGSVASGSILDGGGSGLDFSVEKARRKKKKEREAMKRLVAAEVQKVLKERGLARLPGGGGGGNGDDNDPDNYESDTLAAVRYELVRMQQELLRRHVLDPRVYKALSLDNVAQNKRNVTIAESPMERAEARDKSHTMETRLTPIVEKGFGLRDGQGLIEISLDIASDVLLAQIFRIFEVNADGQEIDPKEIMLDGDDETENKIYTPVGRKKEVICFCKFTKLLLNRMTGNLFEAIMEVPQPNMRIRMFDVIIEQLQIRAREVPMPKGEIYLNADRVLYKKPLLGEGAVADLSISRNLEDNGLVISVTPMLGSSDRGSINVLLPDKELQILLINQRSLYILAQTKWACMQMIAQWIATRIKLRLIRILDKKSPLPLTLPSSSSSSSPPPHVKSDDISVHSAISHGTAHSNISANSTTNNNNNNNKLLPSLPPTSGAGELNKITSISAEELSREVKEDKSPILMDVSIDRKVDILQTAFKQWRSRNVPSIPGMTVTLEACQDQEMLSFEVVLTIPHLKIRKKRLKAGTLLSDVNSFGGDSQSLRSFGGNDDDDDDDDDEIDKNDYNPHVITLSYKLSAAEMSVFGSKEVMGEEKRKVVLTDTSGENHPAAFMWNVLARLHVDFKGHLSDPFAKDNSAESAKMWEIRYDRRLLRDIRTVTGGVMIITVSVVGSELLFESAPTDGSCYKTVGSKLMEESEINEMVFQEGWPLTLLDYAKRSQLAYRILEKLKVVEEKGKHRLEPYTYPETRMLQIILSMGVNKKDADLGSVEISSHHTLTDLRALIRHEIDRDLVPKLYRFVYKGQTCQVRQETFRKAWECLPRVRLVVKENKNDPKASGPSQELIDKKMAEKLEKEKMTLKKGARRVGKKLVPIPVATLCYVQENSTEVYLLHDSRDLFLAGDVIRIGHPQSRDYIVAMRSKALQNLHPTSITIEPAFDLVNELEYDTPYCGNMPFPVNAGEFNGTMVLKTPSQMGYKFILPEDETDNNNNSSNSNSNDNANANANANSQGVVGGSGGDGGGSGGGGGKNFPGTSDNNSKTGNSGNSGNSGPPQLRAGNRNDADELKLAIKRSTLPEDEGTVWDKVWVWKCIPPDEDNRPKWRRDYDDGLIRYEYEYASSKECFTYFRVKARHKYLEILCTDSRVPSLSPYAQRVVEMNELSIDYYTTMAFKNMTEWYPQYKRGVESSKVMKLVRESKIFPDIKKPARQGQLDMIFLKEVRGENGIVDKYVNYTGFCRILQEIALIRYPSTAVEAGKGGDVGSHNNDDASSVAASSVTGSIEGGSSIGGGSHSNSSKIINRKSKNSNANNGISANNSVGANSNEGKSGGGGAGGGKKKMSALDRAKKKADAEAEAMELNNNNNEIAAVDAEHAAKAYRKIITDHILSIPEWSAQVWKEAKLSAMKKEAVPYCAATRIMTMVRCRMAQFKYQFFRSNLIVLQANMRRRIAINRVKKIVRLLVEDWLFRLRYHAATVISSIIRRFCQRCRHLRVMKKIKEQQVVIQKARRLRFRKMRQMLKKAMIYKETKRVNGIMCLMTLWRKDTRAYSSDFGIVIQIYIPQSQQNYKFPIEEKDLKVYMCRELGVEAVSVGDLLDVRNLQKVVSARLIIRESVRPGMPPQVLFSKQALGQRGKVQITRGKRIFDTTFERKPHYFVCKLFESGNEITVQCYHRLTSNIFLAKIGITEFREWVVADHKKHAADEIDAHQLPPLLKPENKLDLYKWTLNHLCVDTRKTFKVLFECQQQRSQKIEMITKIQAAARRALARPRAILLLDKCIIKVKVGPKDDKNFYYVDRRNGQSQWEKPKLLGRHDLPTKPINRWISINYNYDGQSYVHYVNPYNGRYTHLTVDRAIVMMQSLVRNHLLKAIRLPKHVMQKVVPLVIQAKDVYDKDNKKLSSVINFALVTQVVLLDEVRGKELYVEALDLSESSPLVTRCFAVFVVSCCEAPLLPVREKALRWLVDAKRRDPDNKKFAIAHEIYQYALLKSPKSTQALLNLSIVEALIYEDNVRAERYMRRALSIAPFHPRVVEIWNYLKDRFPEKNIMYHAVSRMDLVDTNKGGGKKRIIHGRPCAEDAAWAGWCFVKEDPYKVSMMDGPYWYNPVDGTEQRRQPDFKVEWQKRLARSQFKEEKNGLQIYYDPLTATHFQYHLLSDTCN